MFLVSTLCAADPAILGLEVGRWPVRPPSCRDISSNVLLGASAEPHFGHPKPHQDFWKILVGILGLPLAKLLL